MLSRQTKKECVSKLPNCMKVGWINFPLGRPRYNRLHYEKQSWLPEHERNQNQWPLQRNHKGQRNRLHPRRSPLIDVEEGREEEPWEEASCQGTDSIGPHCSREREAEGYPSQKLEREFLRQLEQQHLDNEERKAQEADAERTGHRRRTYACPGMWNRRGQRNLAEKARTFGRMLLRLVELMEDIDQPCFGEVVEQLRDAQSIFETSIPSVRFQKGGHVDRSTTGVLVAAELSAIEDQGRET